MLAKWGLRLVITACIVLVGYIAVGSWIAAQGLSNVLRVGAPTAQGSGWPEPESPADIGYVGDPTAAFGYGFEDVAIETELGDAPAWLVPDMTASSDRWAIVVHGIGGRRENGYRFLPVLHEAGLQVLIISYRNDVGAPAAPDGLYAFGLTEWADLDAAVQYALDHGAMDIVLVGESMGGAIVGQFLLQSSLGDMVSAIVLDAPALNFGATAAYRIAAMRVPLAPVIAAGGVWLSGFLLPIRLGDANVSDVLAGFAGPLFLSHGDRDRVVPVSGSDALAARRTDVTEYLRTTADHIQSWKIDPVRYDAALAAFLAEVPAQ